MRAKSVAAAVALFVLSGCGQTAGLGDILGGVLGGGAQPTGSGAQSGTVSAEVREVDTRNRVLEVRTDDGQNVGIRYDDETRVVYEQREYPVTALEPGDMIRMNVSRTGQNEYYTAQIEVEQSVQDRTGYQGTTDPDRLYTLSGTVDQVDQNSGLFTLRTTNGRLYSVSMPFNSSAAARDRFSRLRRGHAVSFEGDRKSVV